MTSLLTQVLNAIRGASHPLTIGELSHQLGIDPGVASDMIAYWQRRGRIRLSQPGACDDAGSEACRCCPVKDCALATSILSRYEIVDP